MVILSRSCNGWIVSFADGDGRIKISVGHLGGALVDSMMISKPVFVRFVIVKSGRKALASVCV